MMDFLRDNREITQGVEAITYVPLDRARMRERGFNQSRLLARGIAKQLDIPLINAIKKISRTRHQNELSRDERLINLRGAFKARKGIDLKGKL